MDDKNRKLLSSLEQELASIKERLATVRIDEPDMDAKTCIRNAIAEIESAIGELEDARSSTTVSPRSRP